MFQSLESRKLMAATASLADGVLSIVGTNESDTIALSTVFPGQSRNIVTKKTTLLVELGDGSMTTFAADEVKSIKIVGLGGNDRITLPLAIPSATNGVVVTQDSNGQSIFGATINAYVEGGSGNDTIIGGDGNDTLRGGIGNDRLVDPRGVNRFDGGDGDDVIDSREGKTFVAVAVDGTNGGVRFDYGRVQFPTRPDGVIGGAGNDTLFGDPNDIHSGIEEPNLVTPFRARLAELDDSTYVVDGKTINIQNAGDHIIINRIFVPDNLYIDGRGVVRGDA